MWLRVQLTLGRKGRPGADAADGRLLPGTVLVDAGGWHRAIVLEHTDRETAVLYQDGGIALAHLAGRYLDMTHEATAELAPRDEVER